jgi:hypothetical protein
VPKEPVGNHWQQSKTKSRFDRYSDGHRLEAEMSRPWNTVAR